MKIFAMGGFGGFGPAGTMPSGPYMSDSQSAYQSPWELKKMAHRVKAEKLVKLDIRKFVHEFQKKSEYKRKVLLDSAIEINDNLKVIYMRSQGVNLPGRRIDIERARNLVKSDAITFDYDDSIMMKESAYSFAVRHAEAEIVELLLQNGEDVQYGYPLIRVGSETYFNYPKIAKSLMLYGARIHSHEQYFAKLEKRVYPALSPAMKAAALGEIEEFNEMSINRPGILNAALRYAAINARVDMVKYLLDRGANPDAKCPHVVERVAKTIDLINILMCRSKSDQKLHQDYVQILRLFNLKLAPKKYYWHLRALDKNQLKDQIPQILRCIVPSLDEGDSVICSEYEKIRKK